MRQETNAPYTVADAAKLTGLSRQIITRLFEQEPGVVIRIPRRVIERVMRRHTVQ